MRAAKRLVALTARLGIVCLVAIAPMRAAGLEADWVLYNAKILTADSEDPATFTIAQAVAIYDGKFVVVGSNQQALEAAGPNTRRIDLAGKTILPGLIETHLHVHSQAASHYLGHAVDQTDPRIRWPNNEEGLAQLRALASRKQGGEWIVVGLQGAPREMDLGPIPSGLPSLAEIDNATPDNPVLINLGGWEPFLANSLALNRMLERYPNGVAGMVRDAQGKPTGLLKKAAARTSVEFIPPKTEKELAEVAPAFRKELEEPAARGLTTVATRVDLESLRIYQYLDEREEMPVRLSYAPEMASYHPMPDLLFRRAPARAGHGTPRLWLGGATAGIIEGTSGPGIGAACIHGSYESGNPTFPNWKTQPWGPHGDCRLGSDPEDAPLRNFFLEAAKNGWSVTNIHVNGDRTMDEYLDLLEEADSKYGIAHLRISSDHCGYLTERQAERAKRLGMSFTCTPDALVDAERGTLGAYTAIYDKEQAADAYAPFQRLVRLGMKPSAHCEGHQDWTFTCLELMISRRDPKTGQVWGPQQRINRREALYAFTRWAAWHAWKEKYIGSIEPGKWADLVVIDKDYLTQPEEEISEINPLLTIVGGKLSYSEPSFASGVGLPTIGFQAPPDWWGR
ncbi:MAG: amidohydrolase family protein [Acidobacteria bacterium]|nr:amidohydrolase family protein [Acidobacteriota bacterium]